MRDFSTELSLKTQMLCVGGAGVAGILLTALADMAPLAEAHLVLPVIGAALPLAVAVVLGTRLADRASRLLQSLRSPGAAPLPELGGSDELAHIARLVAEDQRRARQHWQYLAEAGGTLRGTATEVQLACGEAQAGMRRQHLSLRHAVGEIPTLEQAQAGCLDTATALVTETSTVVTGMSEAGAALDALDGLLVRADQDLADSEAALSALAIESSQLAEVMTSLDALAEEISLIALNASIEAARVGSAGEGVAVMADEVTGLAGRARHFSEDFGRTLARLGSGASAAVEPLKHGRESVGEGRGRLASLRQEQQREGGRLQSLAVRLADQVSDLGTTLEITARLAETLGEAARTSTENEEQIFKVSQRTRTLVSLIDAQHVTTINLGEVRTAGRGGRSGTRNT